MAHTKAGGSTALGRDSHGQRLGVKIADGAFAKHGAIITRGNDDTLFALTAGIVKFTKRKKIKYNGRRDWITIARVEPAESAS